jgi:hypothetical protein
MKLPTGTRLALVIGATALLIALALTGALPQRYVMVAVGIVLARIAAVKAARARSEGSRQREAVPSLLWALAMLALVGPLGWDMRLTIVAGVLSVMSAFFGRKYKVAL